MKDEAEGSRKPNVGDPQPGFAERVGRAGKPPISYLMEQAVANPNIISLAAGLVDQESLPVEEVARAAQTVLGGDRSRAQQSLQYGTTDGDPRLRELLCEHLASLEGLSTAELGIDVDRLIVGTGSQQLLYLVGEILLDPGDIVLLGVPAYFVYMGALENLGARMVAVQTDQDGLVPEALEEALERIEQAGDLPRVKFIYDVSYYNNPTGLCLSASRRQQLVELARRWSKSKRIFILEDAAYRELRYRGEDLPSIFRYDTQGDTVLYAGTFSKPFSPGMKTGYLITPRVLRESLLFQKGHHDFGSSNFTHQLLVEVLERRDYHDHVVRLRQLYARKLNVLLDTLQEELSEFAGRVTWTKPEGGLYVWLRLPPEIRTATTGPFFQQCISAGVLYVPGHYCYPRSFVDVPGNYLRLSLGAPSAARIREGVRRFCSVLKETMEELVTGKNPTQFVNGATD